MSGLAEVLQPIVRSPNSASLGIDLECNKHTGCQGNWEIAQWDGLARHYLHPDFPTSPHETLEKLESHPIIGVTEACCLNAVESIKEQKVFERENDMIEKALSLLKAYEGLRTVSQIQILSSIVYLIKA